jgi:hypothetical protein
MIRNVDWDPTFRKKEGVRAQEFLGTRNNLLHQRC